MRRMANPALTYDGQEDRARAVGALIAAGRLDDLQPETLQWYVDRADRLERQLRQLRFRVADALDDLRAGTPMARPLDG
jgi:hypothetical protein